MKNKIIIIGLGQLGRRHAQSVLNGTQATIVAFDIATNASLTWKEFALENHLDDSRLTVVNTLAQAIEQISVDTIVIVATTAKGRGDLLKQIITQKPYAIIAEKPLVQNHEELDDLLACATRFNVLVYCNFPRRVYAYYQEIYQYIAQSDRIYFMATFAGGMSIWGIHFIDLFLWLSRSKQVENVYGRLDHICDAKRFGFKDMHGEMIVRTKEGSQAMLISDPLLQRLTIKIQAGGWQITICEDRGLMILMDPEGKVQVKNFVIPPISQLTAGIINGIYKKQGVGLPTINESVLAHQVLFDFMKQHDQEGLNIT